jgi:hypothetical protein
MTAIAKARAKAILDMIILLVLGRNWPAYEVVIAWGRRIGGLAVIGADLRQSARPGDAVPRALRAVLPKLMIAASTLQSRQRPHSRLLPNA